MEVRHEDVINVLGIDAPVGEQLGDVFGSHVHVKLPLLAEELDHTNGGGGVTASLAAEGTMAARTSLSRVRGAGAGERRAVG